MALEIAPFLSHPKGETFLPDKLPDTCAAFALGPGAPVPVNTLGKRFHVEWDSQAPVTPLGQLVFFAQFLAASGLYSNWVKQCPLKYHSPNAPSVADVLGTWTLASLAGACRYAHVSALRADTVNPQGLGMTKVVSEDSLRRAFKDEDSGALARWQTDALFDTYAPALEEPWICDLDVTVKPIYGHQEGAQLGYNPHKPGRPSHAYHTLFIRSVRIALDVEVRSGKEHAPSHGLSHIWRTLDRLTPAQKPWLLCGDCAYGNEQLMSQCEARAQKYLFRQRQTTGVKQLVQLLESQGGWRFLGEGWEGCEGSLSLSGWTAKRRVIVIRRRLRREPPSGSLPLLGDGAAQLTQAPQYEYQVLVTNLTEGLCALVHLYRQRADVENAYDELKNQWGWGGFTTQDLLRCQVAARMTALVYNWWNLFVRCAEPTRAREAISSRPLLLCAVGRVIKSGGQTILRLTSTHAQAAQAQAALTQLSLFLSGLTNTAEQLECKARWRRIWHRILEPYRKGAAALLVPGG